MALNIYGNIITSTDITDVGVFKSEINRNGLICYLDAADKNSYTGSGTAWYDLTGNFNGNLNGATFDSGNGGSISFNGSSQYVSCGNFGTFYATGTISLWYNSSVLANYNNLFSTKYNGGNVGIRFEENASGTFGVVVGNDVGTYTAYNYISSGMLTSTWYNVVLTWNTSSNMVIGYLNGVLNFTSNHTYWATTLPSVTLGEGFDLSRYWNGKIANFLMYNVMLSPYEIAENFQAQRGRFGI
jgi:hypothetical protein